jgi:hypothetical protein
LVVDGKVQRGVRAEENDDSIAREYAEANSKLSVAPESGLDMKKLSVSWKLPVDRLAP